MRLFPAYCVYHRSLWSVNVSFKARTTAHRILGSGSWASDSRSAPYSASGQNDAVLFDSQRKVKSRPWKTAILGSFASAKIASYLNYAAKSCPGRAMTRRRRSSLKLMNGCEV
jgi:hypothetical protein